MTKTLFILNGSKGSGKATIDSLVAQHTDIVHLCVESFWLGLKPVMRQMLALPMQCSNVFASNDLNKRKFPNENLSS